MVAPRSNATTDSRPSRRTDTAIESATTRNAASAPAASVSGSTCRKRNGVPTAARHQVRSAAIISPA